jgi:hypothetical protein
MVAFNFINGISAGASNFTSTVGITGVATFSAAPAINAVPTTTSGVGAAGTGVAAAEYGDGLIHKTILTYTLTSANDYDFADGADHGSGKTVYTFPEGCILVLGATMNGVVTSDAHMTGAFNMGLGSTECDDAATLATTEQNVIPTTSITQGATQDFHAQLAAAVVLDGTAAAAALWLNVGVPNASTDDATTVAVTGTSTIVWMNAGDY